MLILVLIISGAMSASSPEKMRTVSSHASMFGDTVLSGSGSVNRENSKISDNLSAENDEKENELVLVIPAESSKALETNFVTSAIAVSQANAQASVSINNVVLEVMKLQRVTDSVLKTVLSLIEKFDIRLKALEQKVDKIEQSIESKKVNEDKFFGDD